MTLVKSLRRTAGRLLPQKLKEAIQPAMFRLSADLAATHAQPDGFAQLKISSFNGFEVAYRQGTADERVLKASFDRDILFAEVPEYRPSESDVIVDVGAHIGTFSLLAATKVPRGTVHAVEACQDTFNLLRINSALNRFGNISTHHLALSDHRGVCKLYYDYGNWGHSVVHPFSDRGETVECRTLQEFFQDAGITECSFLKFNCEGAEFPILLSSPASVLQRVRVMLVLYHCDLWAKNTPEDLTAHLRAAGFTCTLRNQEGKRGWIIATHARTAG